MGSTAEVSLKGLADGAGHSSDERLVPGSVRAYKSIRQLLVH